MDLLGADYIKPSSVSVKISEVLCPALGSLVQRQWQTAACPVRGQENAAVGAHDTGGQAERTLEEKAVRESSECYRSLQLPDGRVWKGWSQTLLESQNKQSKGNGCKLQ